MRARGELGQLLTVLLPLLAWFACFSMLYGLTAVPCERQTTGGLWYFQFAMLALALGFLFHIVLRAKISGSEFLKKLLSGLALLSFIATLWLLGPLVALPVC